MPKVSDAHLAARRDQILDAAVRAFAVDGFQATSMTDIVAAAGLSAGAVYRYFPSKEDLVAAVADRVLVAAVATLDHQLADDAAPHPAEVVAALVRMADRLVSRGEVDVSRVAVQIWSESLRNERVREIAAGAYGTIRSQLATVCRRSHAAGALPAGTDPDVAAKVLFSLLPGFLLQRLLLRDVDAVAYTDTLVLLLTGPRSPEAG